MNKLHAAFFNNAEIHFMLFDKDLNVLDVNESTLKCYHLEKSQLVGKHITEIAPDVKTKGLYDKYREVISTGESLIIEDLVSHPKFGNQHNRIKAFKVGEGLGVAAINTTELKSTIDSLELFILQSSHDLRSPIASIVGLTTLAISENQNIDEIIAYCNMIREQAKQMNTRIERLVETIKIRKVEGQMQKINFNEIISDVKKSLAFVEGFSKIKFTQSIIVDQDFLCDKVNLVSLFQNLVSNAIKYRNSELKESFVKIIVADDPNGIKITLSDNGVGIPDKLQENVFKIFFRATQQKDSMGLGLYTVSQIVKKHNGHINFKSKEMEGTTFTIYLPNIVRIEKLNCFADQQKSRS